MFGAAAALALDEAAAEHLLTHWSAGRSALRGPAAAARAEPNPSMIVKTLSVIRR